MTYDSHTLSARVEQVGSLLKKEYCRIATASQLAIVLLEDERTGTVCTLSGPARDPYKEQPGLDCQVAAVQQCTSAPVQKCICALIQAQYKYTSVKVYRHTSVPVHQSISAPVYQCISTPMYLCT